MIALRKVTNDEQFESQCDFLKQMMHYKQGIYHMISPKTQ